MPAIDTVVIGAGHAGLAVSRCLASDDRDHVVLDRGRVAERWRTERWDSLRLLTPNWLTRLPGWVYSGPDQEGYMATADLVRHLERYADSFEAPVHEHTTVQHLSAGRGGYRVVTDRGAWTARNVVIATGPWGRPAVPAAVEQVGPDVHVETAAGYRSPSTLPSGGVLVVGASSSGAQIADELARAGREVLLAVGRHTRMPRRYRGMDVFWWLERTGRLSRTIDDVRDPVAARREPSLQLVGRTEGRERDLDLGTLREAGVRLTGRVVGIDGYRARFAPDLSATAADADRRMRRFLAAVDAHIEATGLSREVFAPDVPAPSRLGRGPAAIDLRNAGIRTVLLAAGYRPHHPWLKVPVLAADGSIRQRRGVTPAPGLYVVGQRFQHRRDSSFIDGARHDARSVVAHIRGRGSEQVPARFPPPRAAR